MSVPVVGGDQVALTEEERAYIESLAPLQMLIDPDWEPYEQVTEDGEFVGIAADLLRLIADRLGVEFHVLPTADWTESLALAQAGHGHFLAFLNKTPQREEFLIFTEPYFYDPNVFVTRVEHDYIADPAALTGARIVLPEGTSIEERVRRDFPNLEVLTVEREAEVFAWVEQGKADMTLRSLTVAAYTIRKEGLFNLKISGEIPAYANQLRMGVQHEFPQLRDILNKGIATLTPQEVQEIVNRHIMIQIITPVDYGLLFRVAGGLLLALLLAALWAFQLRRLNRRLAVSQEELRERERSYATLVANLPGMAYRCRYDDQWTMEFVSAGCEALTGYTPSDLVANRVTSYEALIVEDYKAHIRQAWAECNAQGKAVELEYEIRRADGSLRWVWERGIAVRDEAGSIAALEGLIIDITDHKVTQSRLRQLEKTESLGRMAGAVAHHYNNQMAIIHGSLELAYDQLGTDHPAADDLQTAMRATMRTADMGQLMLAYLGLKQIVREPLDLGAFCDEITPRLEARLPADITLQTGWPPSGPTVRGDKDVLELVIQNLVTNGVEATDTAPGRIKVKFDTVQGEALDVTHIQPATFQPLPQVYARITVSDWGHGFAAADQDRIFEPFYSTRFTGRGLGLAVCVGLLKAHGGGIAPERTAEGVTRMHIYLPVSVP